MFGSFTSRLFGGQKSKSTAKNRLEMVLVQDRSGLSPSDMDKFREEMLEVISRYFVLEGKQLSIEWQRNDSSTALILNTPITGRMQISKAAA